MKSITIIDHHRPFAKLPFGKIRRFRQNTRYAGFFGGLHELIDNFTVFPEPPTTLLVLMGISG